MRFHLNCYVVKWFAIKFIWQQKANKKKQQKENVAFHAFKYLNSNLPVYAGCSFVLISLIIKQIKPNQNIKNTQIPLPPK